jgi:hypothetical protein
MGMVVGMAVSNTVVGVLMGVGMGMLVGMIFPGVMMMFVMHSLNSPFIMVLAYR